MSGNKQRRFTDEFKCEAVRIMGGLPMYVHIHSFINAHIHLIGPHASPALRFSFTFW